MAQFHASLASKNRLLAFFIKNYTNTGFSKKWNSKLVQEPVKTYILRSFWEPPEGALSFISSKVPYSWAKKALDSFSRAVWCFSAPFFEKKIFLFVTVKLLRGFWFSWNPEKTNFFLPFQLFLNLFFKPPSYFFSSSIPQNTQNRVRTGIQNLVIIWIWPDKKQNFQPPAHFSTSKSNTPAHTHTRLGKPEP